MSARSPFFRMPLFRMPFAHTFRFDRFDGFRNAFSPRKPRHPLMRLALGLLAVGLLAVLVVVGVFVGAAMLLGGLLARLWHQRGKPVAPRDLGRGDARVVDAEYRVVGKSALSGN